SFSFSFELSIPFRVSTFSWPGVEGRRGACLTRLVEIREALVPLGCLFIGVSEAQDAGVRAGRAADLQSDGQSAAGEAARHGDGGQSERVKRTRVAQQQQFAFAQAAELRLELRDRRRGTRNGRGEQEINITEDVRGGAAKLGQFVPLLDIH